MEEKVRRAVRGMMGQGMSEETIQSSATPVPTTMLVEWVLGEMWRWGQYWRQYHRHGKEWKGGKGHCLAAVSPPLCRKCPRRCLLPLPLPLLPLIPPLRGIP
jgi:hypothetical protein